MNIRSEDFETQLVEFKPLKDFFVGVDSDGCVFDTMGFKHRECFCPAFINVMGLQSVSLIAREVWEKVNLYSRTRGVNRFIALTKAMDVLREHPAVIKKGVAIPELDEVKKWISREPKLGAGTLQEELTRNPHPDLLLAMKWSEAVNVAVQNISRTVAPFNNVHKTMSRLSGAADTIVVSQTPYRNIELEWREHGILPYVRMIAGQESGTKAMHLRLAALGKYPAEHILMIGDAPGDLQAAEECGVLFYPIIPGKEEDSWKELLDEGIDRFFSDRFLGEYAENKTRDFLATLSQ
ncbi:MAG: HAD family hydrolase [Spirochaetales bacterium]|nr:HAD family hydrolase [Spirochaetales bacterium]